MASAFRSPLVIDNILAVAGTEESLIVTRPFDVFDASVVGQQAAANQTMKVQRQAAGAGGFNDVTDAMACAVIGTVTRAATIVEAQFKFATGDVMKFLSSGNGANGRTRVRILPGAISG